MSRTYSDDHDRGDHLPISQLAEPYIREYYQVLRVIAYQKKCLATQEEHTKLALRKAYRDILVKRLAIQNALSADNKIQSSSAIFSSVRPANANADLVIQLHKLSIALGLIEHSGPTVDIQNHVEPENLEAQVKFDLWRLRRGLAELGVHEPN